MTILIKAIAVDVDGTITSQDRKLDVVAVGAIRKAEASGLPVILATGNALCFAEAVSVLLGTSGPIIAEDGGVVFDKAHRRQYLLGDRMEVDRGLKVLKRRFNDLKETRSSRTRFAGATLECTITSEQVMEVFREEGLNLVAVDSGFAVHIRSPEINKGNGLRKAADLLKISTTEIAAIGDAPNDVELLKVAGLSFAPANSHEMIRKVSNHLMKGAHGEGVKEAIDEILEICSR